jgi:hypothetical protein
MWRFSDLADWWDDKKHAAEEYLHEWSDGHDSWFRVAVAGSIQTAMNPGGGFVDTPCATRSPTRARAAGVSSPPLSPPLSPRTAPGAVAI